MKTDMVTWQRRRYFEISEGGRMGSTNRGIEEREIEMKG
jgi:hypothetical protein